MGTQIDIQGQRFGMLVALRPGAHTRRKWLCRCDCGTEKELWGGGIRSGSTLSCGCKRLRKGDWFDCQLDKSGSCWLWMGSTMKGYGRFKLRGGKSVLAHRFSYERAKGPIPRGLVLDHLCRNPPCCNPAHLEPVTRAVNTQRGVNAKLSQGDADAIRARKAAGEGTVALAREYSLNRNTVLKIYKGRSWRAELEKAD